MDGGNGEGVFVEYKVIGYSFRSCVFGVLEGSGLVVAFTIAMKLNCIERI